MKLLCRWFGHRWDNDGWWKLGEGQRWKRHQTCKRCREVLVTTTDGHGKPLDVYAPGKSEAKVPTAGKESGR